MNTMKPGPCGVPTAPQGKVSPYDDGGPVTSVILADFEIAVSPGGRQTHLQNKAE